MPSESGKQEKGWLGFKCMVCGRVMDADDVWNDTEHLKVCYAKRETWVDNGKTVRPLPRGPFNLGSPTPATDSKSLGEILLELRETLKRIEDRLVYLSEPILLERQLRQASLDSLFDLLFSSTETPSGEAKK